MSTEQPEKNETIKFCIDNQPLSVTLPDVSIKAEGSKRYTRDCLAEVSTTFKEPSPDANAHILDVFSMILDGSSTSQSDLLRLAHSVYNLADGPSLDPKVLKTLTQPLTQGSKSPFALLPRTKEILSTFMVKRKLNLHSIKGIQTSAWSTLMVNPPSSEVDTSMVAVEATPDEPTSGEHANPLINAMSPDAEAAPLVLSLNDVIKPGPSHTPCPAVSVNLSNMFATAFAFCLTSVRLAIKNENPTRYAKQANYVTSLVSSAGPVNKALYLWMVEQADHGGFFSLLKQCELALADLVVVMRYLHQACKDTVVNVCTGIANVGVFGHQHSVWMGIENVARLCHMTNSRVIVALGIRECDFFLKACLDDMVNLKEPDFWYFYIHAIKGCYEKVYSMPKFPQLAYLTVAIQRLFQNVADPLSNINLGFKVPEPTQEELNSRALWFYEKYGVVKVGKATATIVGDDTRPPTPPLNPPTVPAVDFTALLRKVAKDTFTANKRDDDSDV